MMLEMKGKPYSLKSACTTASYPLVITDLYMYTLYTHNTIESVSMQLASQGEGDTTHISMFYVPIAVVGKRLCS